MGYDYDLDLPLNTLFFMILKEKWNEIPKAMQIFPGMSNEIYKIDGFYDESTSSKVNALMLACKHACPKDKVIKCLCKENPKQIYMEDSRYKRMALHIAVMNNTPHKSIAMLMKYNPQACEHRDALGRLPLHYICRDSKRDLKSFQLIAKSNPDAVHTADTSGFLPIHVACRSNAPFRIIKLLIKMAPETLLTKTKKGSTVLTCAKLGKCDSVSIKWLQKYTQSQAQKLEQTAPTLKMMF